MTISDWLKAPIPRYTLLVNTVTAFIVGANWRNLVHQSWPTLAGAAAILAFVAMLMAAARIFKHYCKTP